MPGSASDIFLVRSAVHPQGNAINDLDPLIDLAVDASFVLLGEVSHGTHEFYRMRALIAQRLIAEKGFQAVAAEADWPDAYRVNQYVRGRGNDPNPRQALSGQHVQLSDHTRRVGMFVRGEELAEAPANIAFFRRPVRTER